MTLMEIMVSMAVLSMIGAMSWTALGQTFMARDALERQDAVHQQARVALERMSRELSLAYISGNISVPNSYRTVFVGKDEEPADSLWFAAISHHRIYRDSREADQTELTYWVEPDPNDRDSYVLLHREAPRIDHEPDKDGTILPLAYGVKRLDFKYLDGSDFEWEDEWDEEWRAAVPVKARKVEASSAQLPAPGAPSAAAPAPTSAALATGAVNPLLARIAATMSAKNISVGSACRSNQPT